MIRPAYTASEAATFCVRELAARWGCPLGYVYMLIEQGTLPRSRERADVLRVPEHVVSAIDATWTVRRPVGRLARRLLAGINRFGLDGGFVYFMSCRELVKIGYSKQPVARWTALRNEIPFELTLLGFIPASRDAECSLHRRFMTIRKRNEWFAGSDDLREPMLLITKGSVEGHG
jgi:hypothetical protein